jgi:hypothetical protein
VNIHCDGCKDKVKKLLTKIEGTSFAFVFSSFFWASLYVYLWVLFIFFFILEERSSGQIHCFENLSLCPTERFLPSGEKHKKISYEIY